MSYQLPLFEITSCKCDVILNCFLLGSRTRLCGSGRRKILRSLWKIPEKEKIWRNVEATCSKILRFTSFSLLSLRATSMAKVCQHTEEWAKWELKRKMKKMNYWRYFFILFSGFPDWWSWFWHLLEASTRVRDKQLPLKISESAFSCDACCWWDNSKSLW